RNGAEADSVEPEQTPLRADPKVTIAGLRDGVNFSRQTVVASPAIMNVLRHGPVGIERNRWLGEYCSQHHPQFAAGERANHGRYSNRSMTISAPCRRSWGPRWKS